MPTRRSSDIPSSWRAVAVSIGAVFALVAAQVGASAQMVAFDRGMEAACDERAQDVDRFADVDPDSVHAGAIDCLWVYNVVQGRFVDGQEVRYDPTGEVTRQQMASFVARSLDQLRDEVYALPVSDADPSFDDAGSISSAHRLSVVRLEQAGIVVGYEDGTFRPTESIDRAQMASLIARAIEDVIGRELARPDDSPFTDIGGTHEANIEKLAAIGVVQGRTDTTYAPLASTTRAQMATMIARSLSYFVTEGYLHPMAFAPRSVPSNLGVTAADAAIHDNFDRVAFTLGAGEGRAGWRVRYVDEAIEQGSGRTIDVEGDAIIEVILTGMAYPTELDEDLWDGGRISVNGPGIVEVVDSNIYEGWHQIFIGTTGANVFLVDRLSDPQRVFIDVDHP